MNEVKGVNGVIDLCCHHPGASDGTSAGPGNRTTVMQDRSTFLELQALCTIFLFG